MKKARIDVIIPAYNEEQSVGLVVKDIPRDLVRETLFVITRVQIIQQQQHAKQVLRWLINLIKGYGSACLKGIEYLQQKPITEQPDIVVFLDGDYSDHPEEMYDLVKPIIEENVDLVIGSRAIGDMESGAMMPQQIFGNWLATNLIKYFIITNLRI